MSALVINAYVPSSFVKDLSLTCAQGVPLKLGRAKFCRASLTRTRGMIWLICLQAVRRLSAQQRRHDLFFVNTEDMHWRGLTFAFSPTEAVR